jgi:hypothetical protein
MPLLERAGRWEKESNQRRQMEGFWRGWAQFAIKKKIINIGDSNLTVEYSRLDGVPKLIAIDLFDLTRRDARRPLLSER